MKSLFLKKENNPNLLLFFTGWGGDEKLFNHPAPEGYDYMVCFDYRNLDFDYTLLEGYHRIRLLAWSMGVWAASVTFQAKTFPWEACIAVNGTPRPVDDTHGIPRQLFNATLESFSEATLVRFRRRMCGTTDEVKRFLSHAPCRNLDDLRNELEALRHAVHAVPPPVFGWNKAIVGMNDRIIPAHNQIRCWQGNTPVELHETAHYNEELFTALVSGKEELWTKP